MSDRLRELDPLHILAGLGFTGLGALLLWVLDKYTPWLSHLPFNKWLILIPIILLMGVLIWYLDESSSFSEWEAALVGTILVILVVGLVAFDICFALWIQPWLDGLQFNLAWLYLLILPLFLITLNLTLRVGLQLEEDMSNFGATVLIAGTIVAIVALNILLGFWWSSWLSRLPFNPWYLLYLAGVTSLIFAWVGIWDELNYALLIPAIPGVFFGIALATVTYPLWGPIWYVIDRLFRKKPVQPSGKERTGPWIDTAIAIEQDDRFGFKDYAEVLTYRALEANTPLTIGIFGQWGSGKSSLMRLIQANLRESKYMNLINRRTAWKESVLECIWLNVWELDNREQLWNALLQALFTKIRDNLPWYKRSKFGFFMIRRRIAWGAILRNSYRIIIVALPILIQTLLLGPSASVDDPTAASLQALKTYVPFLSGGLTLALAVWLIIRPAIDAIKSETSLDLEKMISDSPFEQQVSILQSLRDKFKDLVQFWVGEEGRLVVFIDDLDRCTPDNIPEVLEALKLFVTAERCVYIIGADHDVIRDALKSKYGYFDEGTANDYLEKIIQVPFYLPPLDVQKMADFVAKEYQDIVKDCESAPRIFSEGLERNPRKVKGALNIYRTLLKLADVRFYVWEMDHKVEEELVAKMVVIQNRYRELYDVLVWDNTLIWKLERWARTNSKSGTRRNTKNGKTANPILPAKLKTVLNDIADGEKESLKEMLKLGKTFFKDIDKDSLSAYIYLTGTADERTIDVQTSREARRVLLGDQYEEIKMFVDNFFSSRKDLPLDQIKKSRDAYIERLDQVIDLTKAPWEARERWSANLAYWEFAAIPASISVSNSGSQILAPIPATVRIPKGNFQKTNADEVVRITRDLLNSHEKAQAAQDAIQELSHFMPEVAQFADIYMQHLRDEFGAEGIAERQIAKQELLHEQSPIPRFRSGIAAGKRANDEGLAAFSIGRYPVTVREYEAYIRDTKCQPPEYWSSPDRLGYDFGNQPVVGVSWFEATNYCKWLSDITKLRYRLPTEEEWEKAARGKEGRIFPWGNDIQKGKARTADEKIFFVRALPDALRESFQPFHFGIDEGQSFYFVCDAIGNVWEWTDTLNPAVDQKQSTHEQILKGGSFAELLGFVNCTSKHVATPDRKLPNIGFRVALTIS